MSSRVFFVVTNTLATGRGRSRLEFMSRPASPRPEKSTVRIAPITPFQILSRVIATLGGTVTLVQDELVVRVPEEHEPAMHVAIDDYEAALR